MGFRNNSSANEMQFSRDLDLSLESFGFGRIILHCV